MDKEFLPVGNLYLLFKDGRMMQFYGGEGVATCVRLKFDDKNADQDSTIETNCVEIERGLVMTSFLKTSPIIKYVYVSHFTAINNAMKKKYRLEEKPCIDEQWEFKKDENEK